MGRFFGFIDKDATESQKATMDGGVPTLEVVIDFMQFSILTTLPQTTATTKINAYVVFKASWIIDTHFLFYNGVKILNDQARLQINNLVNYHHRGPDAKLYKGILKERTRAGYQLLNALTERYLLDRLNNGTASWDNSLVKWMVPMILSNLAARIGDIVLSDGYSGDEYLRLEHVEVFVDPAEAGKEITHENIVACVSCVYDKNEKDVLGTGKIVWWRFTEVDSPWSCPMAMLIVHALR